MDNFAGMVDYRTRDICALFGFFLLMVFIIIISVSLSSSLLLYYLFIIIIIIIYYYYCIIIIIVYCLLLLLLFIYIIIIIIMVRSRLPRQMTTPQRPLGRRVSRPATVRARRTPVAVPLYSLRKVFFQGRNDHLANA